VCILSVLGPCIGPAGTSALPGIAIAGLQSRPPSHRRSQTLPHASRRPFGCAGHLSALPPWAIHASSTCAVLLRDAPMLRKSVRSKSRWVTLGTSRLVRVWSYRNTPRAYASGPPTRYVLDGPPRGLRDFDHLPQLFSPQARALLTDSHNHAPDVERSSRCQRGRSGAVFFGFFRAPTGMFVI